jgi:hypothetical protein
MDQTTFDAIRAKAQAEDPPRTVSDLTRALLEAWLDDQLDVRFVGDRVSVSNADGWRAAAEAFRPEFDHPLDPFPNSPGLCGTCGEFHYRTMATH